MTTTRLDLCKTVIRASEVERAELFAKRLFGNAKLLQQAAGDWVDELDWIGGIDSDAGPALLHMVWTAQPVLAFEASREGARYIVTVYPFGIRGTLPSLLRIPLRILETPLKQAVQCFLSSNACLGERIHPTRGVLIVDFFKYNAVLTKVLQRYRVLLVACLLDAMCKSWRQKAPRDPEAYIDQKGARLREAFLAKYPEFRAQTEDAWKVARGDAVHRLASALSATIKVEK